MRERNTASVIGAWLYGENDFVKTATTAFNFGWDAAFLRLPGDRLGALAVAAGLKRPESRIPIW